MLIAAIGTIITCQAAGIALIYLALRPQAPPRLDVTRDTIPITLNSDTIGMV